MEEDRTRESQYQDLLDLLTRTPDRQLTLQEVFEGHQRVQRIGLFLAMLELVRLRKVDVCQEDLHAEIAIKLRSDGRAVVKFCFTVFFRSIAMEPRSIFSHAMVSCVLPFVSAEVLLYEGEVCI